MIVLLLLLQRHLGVANGNSGGKDAVWRRKTLHEAALNGK